MHTALVDAAVAEAPLNGTLGSAEVTHVQLLELGLRKRLKNISAIKQSIDLFRRLRGRKTRCVLLSWQTAV